MAVWLPEALLALLSFGMWGFFTKLGILYIDSRSALVFQTVGVVIIGIIVLALLNFKPALETKGIGFGILTGIAYGVGCLFYFFAASKGKITTVVTLTALYPLVTILLSYLILKETVTAKQFMGIVLAFFAILLMAT